jgi:hypothetical protein
MSSEVGGRSRRGQILYFNIEDAEMLKYKI